MSSWAAVISTIHLGRSALFLDGRGFPETQWQVCGLWWKGDPGPVWIFLHRRMKVLQILQVSYKTRPRSKEIRIFYKDMDKKHSSSICNFFCLFYWSLSFEADLDSPTSHCTSSYLFQRRPGFPEMRTLGWPAGASLKEGKILSQKF